MKIQTRHSWNARKARDTTPQADSQIRELFLHYPGDVHELDHIDRDQEQDAYMRGIQNFHMDERGWNDIGYSFAVFQDGRVYRGRGRNVVPAAQLSHNTGTVAVLCVVGNNEPPSHEMAVSLRDLRDYLNRQVGHALTVRAHGDVTSTDCPGPHIRKLINDGLVRH